MSSGEPRRAIRRALRRLLSRRPPAKLEAAFFIAVLLAVSAAVLWDARGRAVEDARATATNLVALLHEQTTTVFHMTDFTLRAAKLRLERETLAQDDPGFRAGLAAERERLDSLRALFVIVSDDFLQHDTDYPSQPRVILAYPPSFTHHPHKPTIYIFRATPLH